MTRFYFDVWSADDLKGTALGEFSQAYNRSFRAADQALGSGQFTINRHDSQVAWVVKRNLVRVRLVDGGPFAWNDARYKFAFFIEEGADVLLSTDEEGGEEFTRGGRDVVAILERAVLYPTADDSRDTAHANKVPETGQWKFKNRTPGEVLSIFLRNAEARTPNPLDPSTRDFGIVQDSTNTDWPDVDTDWQLGVGMNGLEVLEAMVSGGVFFRMGPLLKLQAFEEDPGVDRSATITIAKGVDLVEAAERAVHASTEKSRVIVKGEKKDNTFKYREVIDATIETAIGRIEGYTEYTHTPTNSRLDRAGNRYLRKAKDRADGPETVKVIDETGRAAFVDYVPGDYITIDIPGILDDEVVQVAAIVMEENEVGEADPVLELRASPFDPSNTPEFGSTDDGGKGGGAKCGDCPEPTPFVPETEDEAVNAVVYGPNNGPNRATYPQVIFAGDGDDPPTGSASSPLVGPVEYTGYSLNGTVYRHGLRMLGAAVVDVGYKFSAAEVQRVGPWTVDFYVLRNGSPIFSHQFSGTCAGLCFWSGEQEGTLSDVQLQAGDILTLKTVWSFDGKLKVPAGVNGGYLSIAGTAAGTTLLNEPLQGQEVHETAVVTDGDTTYGTNFAYATGSLKVHAEGTRLIVDETGVGTWSLFDELPIGTRLLIEYQALNGDPLGTGNVPVLGPYLPTIPAKLLGDGSDGSGDNVLHDDGTWRPAGSSDGGDCCGDEVAVDRATLRPADILEVAYGAGAEQNVANGTMSSGHSGAYGGDPANPTNGNDDLHDTQSIRGSFAGSGGVTISWWWATNLGASYLVTALEVYEPTATNGWLLASTTIVEWSDDGTTWTGASYAYTTGTYASNGVGGGTKTRHIYTLDTPVAHAYWRVRKEKTTNGFEASDAMAELKVIGAPVSTPAWVDAPEMVDGDDATYALAETDGADTEFARLDLESGRPVIRLRLDIAYASSGAKSLALWGSAADDYTGMALVKTLDFTATGSNTEDEVTAIWSPAGDLRTFQLRGDIGRVHSWELYQAAAGEIVVIDPTTGEPSLLQGALDNIEAAAGGGGHIADTTDAHDASAVSFTPTGTIAATDVQAAIAEVAAEAGAVPLGTLTDVTITAPAEGDTLRYVSGEWINDDRRWEPVTTNPGTGPEIVFTGDDIVMTWRAY